MSGLLQLHRNGRWCRVLLRTIPQFEQYEEEQLHQQLAQLVEWSMQHKKRAAYQEAWLDWLSEDIGRGE